MLNAELTYQKNLFQDRNEVFFFLLLSSTVKLQMSRASCGMPKNFRLTASKMLCNS